MEPPTYQTQPVGFIWQHMDIRVAPVIPKEIPAGMLKYRLQKFVWEARNRGRTLLGTHGVYSVLVSLQSTKIASTVYKWFGTLSDVL